MRKKPYLPSGSVPTLSKGVVQKELCSAQCQVRGHSFIWGLEPVVEKWGKRMLTPKKLKWSILKSLRLSSPKELKVRLVPSP